MAKKKQTSDASFPAAGMTGLAIVGHVFRQDSDQTCDLLDLPLTSNVSRPVRMSQAAVGTGDAVLLVGGWHKSLTVETVETGGDHG